MRAAQLRIGKQSGLKRFPFLEHVTARHVGRPIRSEAKHLSYFGLAEFDPIAGPFDAPETTL